MLLDHFAGKSGDTDLAGFVSLSLDLPNNSGTRFGPRALALINRIADGTGPIGVTWWPHESR